MNVVERARQLLGDEVFAMAQAAGHGAPELTDEQIARLRTVLAEPAAVETAA